ncbi:MAG: hypothetical protein K2M47_00415, partial [Clostridiales bacterium]|nr:hypothetical protein [Clostridiales bacterium]
GVLAHDHCSVCNKDFIDGVEKTAAELKILASHNLTFVDIQNKTCTTDGVLAHDHCSVCNKDFIDGVEKTAAELKIAAAHTWGSDAVRVEPDCTTDGSVTGTCTVCGITDVEVLPKLGHDIVRHYPQAPTCTESGWGMYESCSRGDYSTYEEIDPLGHSWGEFVIDKQPTCTAEGSKSKHCTRCDEKFEVTAIAALGHTLTHNPKTPATNDRDGNIEFWDCEDCQKFFADGDGKEEITDKASVVIPKTVDPITNDGLSGTDILWITLIAILCATILIEVAVIVYRAKRKSRVKEK